MRFNGQGAEEGMKVSENIALNEFNFFFPGATTPNGGVVFYSPLAGFSLLAYEVT